MGNYSLRLLLINSLAFLMFSNAFCAAANTIPSSKANAMLDCFTHSPGRALSNASSSHEFFNVSPDDCLRFCSTDRVCNTVVYHKHFSTCQLYSGAEEGEAAQEVIAKGHDLYMKKECEEHRREQEKDEAGSALKERKI